MCHQLRNDYEITILRIRTRYEGFSYKAGFNIFERTCSTSRVT